MNPKAFVGAIVGSVIGAFIWGGITYATNYEIGWIAWGIGGLIGFCAAALGGEGFTSGALCAILALLSIFGGKMLAIKFTFGNEMDSVISQSLTPEVYESQKKEAAEFATITSKDKYPEFMLANNYTEATQVSEISQEEILDFEDLYAQNLKDFHKEQPDYNDWKASLMNEISAGVNSTSSLATFAMEGLGLFDILFAFLGLITAFKMGAGIESE